MKTSPQYLNEIRNVVDANTMRIADITKKLQQEKFWPGIGEEERSEEQAKELWLELSQAEVEKLISYLLVLNPTTDCICEAPTFESLIPLLPGIFNPSEFMQRMSCNVIASKIKNGIIHYFSEQIKEDLAHRIEYVTDAHFEHINYY